MFGISNVYDDEDDGLSSLARLSNLQSGQAFQFGERAAKAADPFAEDRGKYTKQLSDLMTNPGSFASSPTYQFAYNQGLEALNRRGGVRSGAKMAALTKYGQDMASQQFNNQANLLSRLALTGSSPSAAAMALSGGFNRGQDFQSIGGAAKASKGGGRDNNRRQYQETMPLSGLGGSYGGGNSSLSSGNYGASYFNSPYTPVSTAGRGFVSTGDSYSNIGGGLPSIYEDQSNYPDSRSLSELLGYAPESYGGNYYTPEEYYEETGDSYYPESYDYYEGE